jgi:peroxiredoxin
LRSFQEKLAEFEKRGVRLVAISVDSPDVTKPHIEKQGYKFTFLCDEKMDVIRKWDLLHPGAFRGADIARPAEFLLDSSGTVRWRNLTENYRTRPKADDMLKVIDELGMGK